MPSEKVLIVDDEPRLRQLLGDRLEASGYRIFYAANGREGVEQAQEKNPDVILMDFEMPEKNGLEALAEIRERNADTPVIMLMAHGTLSRAVEAMKNGAYDFLPKPCEPDHLLLVIRKALERKHLVVENAYLKEELAGHHRLIIGESARMKQILEMARRVAVTNATVLIEGESGTGKQVLAQTIHAMSERRDQPFVQVNCTTLSEQLLESDLFGHEKGAFTGAHQAKKGRVELADGGTLFLDEIGDLAPSLQAKFFHFLEHGKFEHVGGMKTLSVDTRVIAATNKTLTQEVKEGRFRGDLFFRLNVVSLTLPPLRERAVVLALENEITPDLLPPLLAEKLPEAITAGMPLDEATLKFKKTVYRKNFGAHGWQPIGSGGYFEYPTHLSQ